MIDNINTGSSVENVKMVEETLNYRNYKIRKKVANLRKSLKSDLDVNLRR